MYTVIEKGASREGVMGMGNRAGPTITKCVQNAAGKPIPLCVSFQRTNAEHHTIPYLGCSLCKVIASVVSIVFLSIQRSGFRTELPGKLLGTHSSSKVFFCDLILIVD